MNIFRFLIGAVASMALSGWATADDLVRVSFDISPRPLGQALTDIGEQAGLQILVRGDDLKGARTLSPPIKGDLTVRAALDKVLASSGLTYEFVDSRTVRVRAVASNYAPGPASQSPGKDGAEHPLVLAQGSPRETQVAAADGTTDLDRRTQPSSSSDSLQEVIVSAQKREERLVDVPVPVSAISADALVSSNQTRIEDYFSKIPGVSLTLSTQGTPQVAIRGISTYAANPTVAFMVDGVPYGSSSFLGGGGIVPEISPSELARVEVLRGPQGTLYGASSIGGVMNYVTVEPSAAGTSADVQVGASGVHNGDGAGYNLTAAVNVPLSSTLAMRASGFARDEPGYIDNVTTGGRGVNRSKANGGRLSALWKPTDGFSIKLGALIQKLSQDGLSRVDPVLGDLQQATLRGTGSYERKSQVYSLTLNSRLSDTGADLTAVSGYSIDQFSDVLDLTSFYGALASALFHVNGAPEFEDNRTTKFTEEVRLYMPIGQKLEWLLGVYYSDERSLWNQDVEAADGITGQPVASGLFNKQGPLTFKEYAAFTDVTLHFTEQFDVQVGGRESHNKQTYDNTVSGRYVPVLYRQPSPLVTSVDTDESAFTYLVTPRLRISPDLMIYARLASGYRPGGPNFLAEPRGLPVAFRSDTTRNYEVGMKGDVLNRALTFDASVYYINWKDFQTQISLPQGGYTANGSAAKSQGVELSLQSRLPTATTLSTWVTWNEAVLTKPMPSGSPVFGVPGDRLPFSARFSGNVDANQEFAVTHDTRIFLGGAVSYVGDRLERFRSVPQRQVLPGYASVDLRTGAQWRTWTLKLYANNVADRRGVLQGGLGTNFPKSFYYIQPRTVGLSLAKTW